MLKRCRALHNSIMNDAPCDPVKAFPFETEVGPKHSVSQIATCQGAANTTSRKLLSREIDLDRRRAEPRAVHARDLARAEVKMDAAAASETDAKMRLPIGEAKLEDEEKYIALSESSLSVRVSGRYKHELRFGSVVASGVPKTKRTRRTDLNQKCPNLIFVKAGCQPTYWAASEVFGY